MVDRELTVRRIEPFHPSFVNDKSACSRLLCGQLIGIPIMSEYEGFCLSTDIAHVHFREHQHRLA